MHRLAVVLGTALLLAAVVAGSASGHDRPPTTQSGVSVPLVMSPNVRLLSTFPETGAISGEFARAGNFFYVSSADGPPAVDVSAGRLGVEGR